MSETLAYPRFQVPGVKQEDEWQLFNVSNWEYYCMKVKDLQAGICPFCQIDSNINKIVHSNDSFNVWHNTVAARSGEQEYQLVIPTKRHITNVDQMNPTEWVDFGEIFRWINQEYSIDGGVIVARSGNPARNAKSIPHIHFNYHVPTGQQKVEITIGKSLADLTEKIKVLEVYEEMRLFKAQGVEIPFNMLSEEKQKLVKDKLSKKAALK
jgi:diadenosine tetraphosphate (Ap4A) HIT family hydrolase